MGPVSGMVVGGGATNMVFSTFPSTATRQRAAIAIRTRRSIVMVVVDSVCISNQELRAQPRGKFKKSSQVRVVNRHPSLMIGVYIVIVCLRSTSC